MDKPVIEKGIPIPEKRGMHGYSALLRELKPGDSVLLPIVPYRAYGLGWKVLGKGNFRSKKENGGTRVWRIS